jgi:hypothetical protein
MFCFKGTVSQDFLLQVFFHESSFPKPLRIKLGPFQFFSKISRDIRKSRYTTSINDTVNFPTGAAGVVDTGGKFAEVGGPQLSSANSKSMNLQTYKICNNADVRQVWQFAICEPNIFCDLLICDLGTQIFCGLESANSLFFSLQIHT